MRARDKGWRGELWDLGFLLLGAALAWFLLAALAILVGRAGLGW